MIGMKTEQKRAKCDCYKFYIEVYKYIIEISFDR